MYPRSLSESGLDWSGLVKRANSLKTAGVFGKKPKDEKSDPKDMGSAVRKQKLNDSVEDMISGHANEDVAEKRMKKVEVANPRDAEMLGQPGVGKPAAPVPADFTPPAASSEYKPHPSEYGPVDDRLHGPMPATLLDRAYQHRVPLGLAALLVGGGGAGLAYYLNKRRKKRQQLGM